MCLLLLLKLFIVSKQGLSHIFKFDKMAFEMFNEFLNMLKKFKFKHGRI